MYNDKLMRLILKFQFHKGTIRTYWRVRYKITASAYFNSIKVRLELNKDKARRLLDWNFNSIKVRLEPVEF